MSQDKSLWECSKYHEHFYQYVIDNGTPVCFHKAKDCPAKQAASLSPQETPEP